MRACRKKARRGALTPQAPIPDATRRDGPSFGASLRCSGSTHRSFDAPSPSRLGLRRDAARRGHGSFCYRLQVLKLAKRARYTLPGAASGALNAWFDSAFSYEKGLSAAHASGRHRASLSS